MENEFTKHVASLTGRVLSDDELVVIYKKN